jgi:hypothetical protein
LVKCVISSDPELFDVAPFVRRSVKIRGVKDKMKADDALVETDILGKHLSKSVEEALIEVLR